MAVNWHTQDEYTRKDEDLTPVIELPETLSDQERSCAVQIAERILRSELEKSLRKKIIQTSELENAKDLTANHQLSRLRRLIRELQLAVESGKGLNPKRLVDYQDQIETRRSTRDQFQRLFVNELPLFNWINRQLGIVIAKEEKDEGEEDEEKIKIDETTAINAWSCDPIKLGNGMIPPAAVTLPLAHDYSLRLIDAVLHRTIKARKNRGDNQ